MNIIKLTLAAAVLTIGIAASAAALPVDKLGTAKVDGIQADQVRLVCNRYGRCWRTGYPVYRYGYRGRLSRLRLSRLPSLVTAFAPKMVASEMGPPFFVLPRLARTGRVG